MSLRPMISQDSRGIRERENVRDHGMFIPYMATFSVTQLQLGRPHILILYCLKSRIFFLNHMGLWGTYPIKIIEHYKDYITVNSFLFLTVILIIY